MNKWIAEFDLEDGDTMPEHMDLNYMGAKIDFHCRPMWIPCSERLPSKANHTDDMVLVCYRNGSVRFNTYMNGWAQGNPVAWMPLPEPYRGESEV